MSTRRARWSDHDHYLGPFTYARDRRWKPLAIMLDSGGDEYPGCTLRFSGFGHTLIIALPPVIKPWREKVTPKGWDEATIKRLGRDWYWSIDAREYGFTCSDGHLIVHLGRQTHDSSTTKSWSCFLPWTQWRFIRHSLYGLNGEHVWTAPKDANGQRLGGYDALRAAREQCPTRTFAFTDFDGERLTVETMIEERQWLFGTGWFKWLSIFRRPMVRRSLDLQFHGETGRRKGSWKGGTLGHSIDMLPEELHEAAFRRYCPANEMTFIGEVADRQARSAVAPDPASKI